MLRNFLQSLKTLVLAIPRSLWKIARLVGLRLTKNLSPYSLEVRYQSGMYRKFVLLVQDSKLSVEEQVDQDPSKIFSNSPVILLREQQGENSPQSNVTISSVRLQKLSWWEESVDLLLLAYPISQMKECEMQSLVHGGTKTHKEHSQTTQLRTRKNQKLEFSWTNGWHYTSPRVENEESSTVRQRKRRYRN